MLEPSVAPESVSAHKPDAQELEDHVALLSRWFYAQPREGEIFFAAPKPVGWPYRRILRACARLLAQPSAEAPKRPQ